MKLARSRPLAAAAALALCVQSTGAASLPIALLAPRAAFPPPAGRLAAFPAPRAAAPAAAPAAAKAPAGPSWFDSLRIVSDFVLGRVQAELAAPSAEAAFPQGEPAFSPRAEPAPAPAPVPEAVAAAAAGAPFAAPNPGAAAPADRMMIVMEPGTRVDAVLDPRDVDFSAPPPASAGPAPVLPPYREAWHEQGGLRARVSYLRSLGVVRMDARGWTATFADGTIRRSSMAPIPGSSFRYFPIYYHGQEVEIALTVENKTGRTMRDVRLEAIQETFRPVGTEGMRLAPPVEVPVAKSLAPGAKAVVKWRVPLEGASHELVNLEQTHVRVTAGGAAAPLLDVPQAGVIDPPGPGWR